MGTIDFTSSASRSAIENSLRSNVRTCVLKGREDEEDKNVVREERETTTRKLTEHVSIICMK